MKNFTDEQQKAFIPAIKHNAWINTALLGSLLLSAYLKQEPAGLEIILLFITWTIHRMQCRELGWNRKVLFSIFNLAQYGIMLFGIVGYVMVFIK